ncbi:MAG: glycosyltransferase family 1 protein [Bradyrhizobium sp.]|nr:glycosyltransferase family 1 protein [Bradyrhizobium sp.]
MANFLFLTWSGAGNQPPAIALGQTLKARGHAVAFAGYDVQRTLFTERGLDFVLLERASAAWKEETPERRFAVKLRNAWASSDHLADLPELLSRKPYDAIVVDCLMFGALAAAEKTGLPTVTFIHSAPGALMPPGGQFESRILQPVNDVRRRAGVDAVSQLWEAWARFPAFSNSVRELDPLGSRARSFEYFGPMTEPSMPSGWTWPRQVDHQRPLVLVSFSTGREWDQSSRITRTLEAIAGRNCRALITTGPVKIDARSVPDNAVIVERLSHDEILPQAALTITHAGHGTVIAALKHGVPLLCLPNKAADQPLLAAQVHDLGCGLSLDGDNATPREIREAIDRLILEPNFAAKARALAGAISASPGMSAAVARLEELASG